MSVQKPHKIEQLPGTKAPKNVKNLPRGRSAPRPARQPMQQVCFTRPNRSQPRHWSMRSVAKVYCHALTRHGGTRAEFEKALLEVCDAAGKEKKTSAAAQALALAEETIANNEDILGDSYRMFQIVNGLLSLLLSLVPFARFGNLVTKIIGRASALPSNVVQAEMQVIQIQRAANDAALRIIRQAAANEARFVRAANE